MNNRYKQKKVPFDVKIKSVDDAAQALLEAGFEKRPGTLSSYKNMSGVCYVPILARCGETVTIVRIDDVDGEPWFVDEEGHGWFEFMLDSLVVFAEGKDDSKKEPFHLIPEIVVRELQVAFKRGSHYVWPNFFIDIVSDERLTQMEHFEMVKDVLKFGAEKYAPDSWKFVENAQDRYCGAMFRHRFKRKDGEKIDPESGLSHLAHELCNVIFLTYFEIMESIA